jgi:glycosyltransferase involved in cell wall biosynthesis
MGGVEPLVTLITPSYNMARFLPETIGSVLAQTYPHIEYRVLDGGSTDGTVELLRIYGERFEWLSEADGGAAAALQTGFAGARGEILGWLNADDTLTPGAVAEAVAALAAHPDAAAVYGRGAWITVDGAPLGDYPVDPDAALNLTRDCGICQPACFFRADAYRAAGGIDPRWGSAFDYDLWIRLARQGRLVYVPGDWARSRMHRDNKTLGQRGQAFEEGMAVLDRHFGYVPANWVHSEALWRLNRRDQFFEPARGTLTSWAQSLRPGLRRNRGRWRRYLWDWLMLPVRGVAARLKPKRFPAR